MFKLISVLFMSPNDLLTFLASVMRDSCHEETRLTRLLLFVHFILVFSVPVKRDVSERLYASIIYFVEVIRVESKTPLLIPYR